MGSATPEPDRESAKRWGVVGLAFKAAGDLLSPGLGTSSFFLLGLCPDVLQCLLWGTPSRTPFLAPQPLPRAPWTLETRRVSSKHTVGACRPAGSAGKPPDSPPWTLDSGTRGLLHTPVWLGSDSRTSLEGGQDGDRPGGDGAPSCHSLQGLEFMDERGHWEWVEGMWGHPGGLGRGVYWLLDPFPWRAGWLSCSLLLPRSHLMGAGGGAETEAQRS